ncbi:MAG: nucleotidyltransferase, partial [Symploca sp. SIO3E6]|nr:nucleotidyltransferase [Caldora sp. SIO3E6]
MKMLAKLPIDLPEDKLKNFCDRWQVRELSLFG